MQLLGTYLWRIVKLSTWQLKAKYNDLWMKIKILYKKDSLLIFAYTYKYVHNVLLRI
jgi:hypothetical protein